MLLMLSRLIPFRDYVYAAAAIAAVVWYNVHVHNLEVRYAEVRVAAVKQAEIDASARALSAAKALADAKEREYANQLSQVEDTYETQLQDADTQRAADIERVRQLEAARGGHTNPVLPSPSLTSPGPDAWPGSDPVLGVGVELADALRHDDAQLEECWRERDSLTGK